MPHPSRKRSRRRGGDQIEEEGGPGGRRDSSQFSDPSPLQPGLRSPPPPDHAQSHSDRPSRPSFQEENSHYSPPTPIASSLRSGNPALQVYPSLAQIPLSRLRTRIHPAPSPLSPTTSQGQSHPSPGNPPRRGQKGPRGPRTSKHARTSVPLPNGPSTGPPHRGADADPSEERRTTIDVSMNLTGPDQLHKVDPNEASEGIHVTAGLPGTQGRLGSTTRFGYTANSGDSRVQDDQFRTYSLQLLQHPVRSRALDREPWRTVNRNILPLICQKLTPGFTPS
ncbi:hypothetical protein DB88DRAFT_472444 [Papiliotrema laurentii]|uniref:Uncharacterized protein n=1 Tax=Papiliotrema laurentii TaxID=5418 RepID=A0AAD9L761_PAPLA|nr:hypothetical protein DB88DRAFT_472444 [Papiliotrema laurentii]